MWTSHDTVGFAVLASFCFQIGFSFEGQFTDLPSNTTAREGQNIEMACAFQSGTASVYLEIQWWFIKAPVSSDSSEDIQEMEITLEPDPDNDGTKISTVKVQGNDISHKLQISRVSKNDEGLYECRVTRANYGEIVEHKAQAWLRVNSTSRPHRPTLPVKKSSPLHLTDKKPRKPSSPLGHDAISGDQMAGSTSSSRVPSKSAKDIPSSATPGPSISREAKERVRPIASVTTSRYKNIIRLWTGSSSSSSSSVLWFGEGSLINV